MIEFLNTKKGKVIRFPLAVILAFISIVVILLYTLILMPFWCYMVICQDWDMEFFNGR